MKMLFRAALVLSIVLQAIFASATPAAAQPDPSLTGLPAAATLTGAEVLPIYQGGQYVMTTLAAACSTHAASVNAPSLAALPGASAITGTELVPLYQARNLVASNVTAVCSTHAAFTGTPQRVGLPGAGALAGTELVRLYQGGVPVAATIGQIAAFAGGSPIIVNTRFALSNAVSTGNTFYSGVETLISPPWDSKNPSFALAGFYGKSGAGETALGNDKTYDDLWIEINGVQTTLTCSGSTTCTVVNGTSVWTDPPAITLPKNTVYRVGWDLHVASTSANIDDGGPLAMPKSYIQTADNKGDYQARGSSSFASAARATTGNIAAITNVGFAFPGAPVGVVGIPLTAADVSAAHAMLIAGMSIDWGANESTVGFAAGHDPLQGSYGGLMRGIGSTTNGRMAFMNLAVPGTRLGDLVNGGADSQAGWSMRDAMMAAKGYPWTTAIVGGPINDVTQTGLTQATLNGRIDATASAFKARGGHRFVMTTMRPNNYSQDGATVNGYLWTQEAHQGGSAGGGANWTGVDSYIRSRPANVDAVIDVYPALGSTSFPGNWKADSKSYTIATSSSAPGANAAGQKQIVIAGGGATPSLGDEIALNPQAAAGASEKFIVQQILTNGDGTITLTQRTNLAFSYSAAETAAGIMTDDGVHTSHQGALAEAAIVAAAKGSALQ